MRLLKRRNDRAENRFQHLVEQGGLPGFPSVVADAIQQVATPEVDLGEVAMTVAADPNLTVTLLKLANSPTFAPRNPITSVHHAVVLLGRNQLESLLIATGVSDAVPAVEIAGFSAADFWLHGATRAAAAAALAAVVDPATQYDQFTVALLQDMAQPVLMLHDPAYAALVAECGGSHTDLARREPEVLGFTHSEIGELLCSEWGLPASLSASVSAHHDPQVEGHEIARWAAHIDWPTMNVDLLVEKGRDLLDVDAEDVLDSLEIARTRGHEIASVFG